MSWLHGLRYAARSLLRFGRFAQERREEAEFHREMEADRLRREGLPDAAARLAADAAFGWPPATERDLRWYLETFTSDLRLAVRTLRRSPLHVTTVVMSAAGAVAIATMVASILGALFVRPLPFRDSERLVVAWQTDSLRPQGFNVSLPNFRDWAARTTTFAAMAAWSQRTGAIADDRADARPAHLVEVTGDFFRVLGAQPMLGRALDVDDEKRDDLVVVLSHRLWHAMFGGDSTVPGRRILVNGNATTVIGVMPPDVRYPPTGDLWISWPHDRQQYLPRNAITQQVVARLADGMSFEQALAELDAVARSLAAEHPVRSQNQATGALVRPLREELFGRERPLLVLLGAGIAFVLLVACLNLACAGLARALDRVPDLDVRTALGAPRWRLLQSAGAEALVLAVTSSTLALLAAPWMTAFVWRQSAFASMQSAHPRVGVGGGMLAVLLSSGIMAATVLWPAWHVSRARRRLVGLTRQRVVGTRSRASSILVGVQVAMATLLLVGAGLAARSTLRLLAEPRGFDASRVLTVGLRMPHLPPARAARLSAALLDSVRAIPGVTAVGAVNHLPLTADAGRSPRAASAIVAHTAAGPVTDGEVGAGFHAVDGEYFTAMRIPVQRGRAFTASDDADAPRAAVISESMARRFWANEDALGRTFEVFGADSRLASQQLVVVGVVGDVRTTSLEQESLPDYYVSYAQGIGNVWHRYLVIRTAGDPSRLVPAVRQAIRAADPQVAMEFATMEHRLARSLVRWLLAGATLGTVAVIGLVVVLLGVYGVVAYTVTARRREIGLRIALGATPAGVQASVLRSVARLVVPGVAAGVAGALALGNVLQQLVFELSPRDPVVLTVATLAIGVAALAAAFVPARRATRIDPNEVLRA